MNNFIAELLSQTCNMTMNTVLEKVIKLKKIPSHETDLYYNQAILDVMFELGKMQKIVRETDYKDIVEKNM